MFGGGSTNPYDEVVVKTTDENLTSENWELIMNLCDKVQDEGQEGAHNVIAAVLKRLAHRNPNVQLYALSLSESLSKNCDIQLHREIASRAFTQGLEKLIADRTTHDKVRQRALALIAMWTAEFENDSTLGIMEDCYKALQAKNYRFETPQEPPPPTVDDEIRRKEEEDLQRVLALSIQDKGGRAQWDRYNDVGASGSSSSSAAASSSNHAAASSSSYAPTYAGGYAPARSPSPKYSQPPVSMPSATPAPAPAPATSGIVTRVRALHTFEPTEPGELGFEKGDIIKVVDRGYKDWWRGQLKGRTGIFPVNYVEAMPEPTAAELGREAEQEAAVFAQAVNVEKLLTMLRQLDPAKDNLADNEEIQELYRSSMALRPKIVKLIDKYSQKRADLVSMNETFVRARTIFDRMMEESLSRHGMYDQPQGAYRPPAQPFPRPESAYGYGAPGAYPTPAAGQYPSGPQSYGYGPGPAPYGQPQPAYGAYGPQPYPGQPAPTPGPQGSAPGQQVGPISGGPIPGQQAGPTSGQPQGPTPQQGPIATQQTVAGPVQQEAGQQGPGQIQQSVSQGAAPAQQVQTTTAQQQQQPERQVISPYVYDPNTTYADPNVQAWAQYYAKGGKDLAGAVYFISVPGVTDELAPPDPAQQSTQQQLVQQQPLQQQPVQQQQPIQQQPVHHQPIQQHPVEQQLAQQQNPAQQQQQSIPGQHSQHFSTSSVGRTSMDVLPSPYPEDTHPTSSEPYPSSPPQQYSSPLFQQQYAPQQFSSPPPQQPFSSSPPQSSPVAAGTTPSWVLPKTPRSPPAAFGGGTQAQGSYQGVGTTA